MSSEERIEKLVAKKVTYTLYKDGQFYIVENVPARVDVETGDQYFSPETVENLQQILMGHREPVRTIQAAVFDFAQVFYQGMGISTTKDGRNQLGLDTRLAGLGGMCSQWQFEIEWTTTTNDKTSIS